MAAPFPSLCPPQRVLCGPGPSVVAPSVLGALSRPTLGHLDPAFLVIMDELRHMLRLVFGTSNELTLAMSGTGSAGMETCMANLVECGDSVLVCVNGVFGGRMAEVAERCGAKVVRVEAEWGRALDPDDIRKAAKGQSFKVMAIVHAETSTGVLQDLSPMRAVADELGALLVVDCVTSLGGYELGLDALGVDAAYSGTQKCLSCPPGLAPVTFSPRAVEVMGKRQSRVQSWYLDLSLIASYWGEARSYHHTAPINMLYGLHEALRLVLEEGLAARASRHQAHARALVEGLEAMGVTPRVPAAERLAPLTAAAVPDGVDDATVRRYLLEEFDLEIGGGLGPMAGNTWRIGLMGAGSTRRNVRLVLDSLGQAMGALAP